MAYRTSTGRVNEYDDRDYYPPGPPRRPLSTRGYDDLDFERRETRGSPPRRAPVREYEDTEISIRERERTERTPAFLREEPRRGEAGALVLRAREIETMDRRRPRSPSPVRLRERVVERRKSLSPPPAERTRTRIIERDRERSPAPPSMTIERRPRFIERERSPSPTTLVRVESRHVERRRERSPTPTPDREEERIRIVRHERIPSPTPSPSPPPPLPAPPVIRGPTIEREVITHYRDIDHGVERAKAPTPPPPAPRPSRARERETDIDIYTSRGETEVDIHKRTRSRSRPAERRPERPQPATRPSYYDDEVIVQNDRDRLRISSEHNHRRAHSAAPQRPGYDEEADEITGKINSRGRMGEALNGATKDWAIIDVPPGTERVRMDGVGGGGAEVTWQRYSGVRRAKFIPERDGTVVSSSSTSVNEPTSERDRLSVQVYDSHRDPSRDRSVAVEDVHDTRISIRDRDRDRDRERERRPVKKQQEMWTEITKDLVIREAIDQLGYEFEETEYFFYVMQYLRYEDVLELVNVSDSIRKARRERAREIEWEREARERWERRHRPRHSGSWDKYDDERVYEREREVIVDHQRPVRGYLR
ncbi:uncharacterized protein BCR38DRAFT_411708 [Pseudomassariella vexata]|uniref:DUF8035 domain-containing protein n=1 Tax=Pseudomassariella vexata TaxID=1141098 RepID=A0A1Y2DN12_9PEZI|nr:uncharacterized protein BCR38DRAFT_411708 [Pseudomassariella vexata]ORY60559.1 hypothetical protein BCR38DRAFT_411708 [Pseudomassariella vexata]